MEATSILLVHLTDLHIKSSSSTAAKRLTAIAGSIGRVIEEPTEVVVLLSGDIAHGGLPEQYGVTENALQQLRSSLESWPITNFHVVTCPGNHDLNFKAVPEGLRATLVTSSEIDGDNPSDILAPLAPLQKSYFEFDSSVSGAALRRHNCIVSEKDIHVGSFCLRVVSINTSWASQLHEVPGTLRIPQKLLVEINNDADFAVVIGHHPLNWFTPRDAVRLSEWLDQTADTVFWGHEHRLDEFQQVRSRVGSNVSHQIGLPMDDESSKCGVKLVRLALNERSATTFDVCFENETKCDVKEIGTFPLHHNQGRESGAIRFSTGHQAFLDDPGAGFSHPRINRPLDLADLFVSPDFREFKSGKVVHERVENNTTLRQVTQGIYEQLGSTLIFGNEQSGKTTFAKVLSREAKSKLFIPIYLDASNLKSTNKGEIRGWLNSAIASQYPDDVVEQIRSADPSRVIVILDNAHAAPGNVDGVDLVLKFLEAKAKRILILTADNPTVSLITIGKIGDDTSYLKGTRVFELLPLGHRRRGELIRRWVSLGRNVIDDSDEIEAEVRQVKTLLDRVLGKNSLPKYPLFVLVMLQQLEGMRDNRTVVSNGSHGYLFEALITQALDRHVRSHEISTVHNFLAAFSRCLWEREANALTSESIESIVQNFMHKLVQIDSGRLLKELVAARMISDDGGLFRFRYPYLYYYYLAKWICSNRSSTEATGMIKALVELVHTERSSNVLMFIAHHEHEDLVISELLPLLERLFADEQQCKLEDQSNLLIRFRTSSQRSILLQGSASDVSDAHHAQLDTMSDSDPEETETAQFEDSLKFNTTLKTISTLGQVLKSRATSVSPEAKIEIARGIVSSSRRLMSFLYRVTEESAEVIVHAASEAFEKRFRFDKEQAIGAANALIGAIVGGIAQICVGRAADALGSTELKPLIDKLEKECQDPDTKLFLLVTKISREKVYPKEAVEDFVKSLKISNILPVSVLSASVARRFYLEPPERHVRESACKLLGIHVKKLPGRIVS